MKSIDDDAPTPRPAPAPDKGPRNANAGRRYPQAMDRSAQPDVTDVEYGDLRGRIYASKSNGGNPDGGPAFLLVHGIGVSHRYLARLHKALALSADTYSIDLPGFGPMPKPKSQLSVEDYASFIREALTDLGITENCVVVGHSMGTQFGVEAALQDPGQFSHVVLMGPVVDPKRRHVLKQAWDLMRDGVGSESWSSNVIVFSDYWRCGPRWYLKELPVMMDYPMEDRVAQVQAPVLVIRGERDPIAKGDWARRLATRAGGQFAEFPGCGHVVQHLATEKVAEVIRTFAGLPAVTSKEGPR
jgi:pimeloyl-ACP methyl ester carboxylesterase